MTTHFLQILIEVAPFVAAVPTASGGYDLVTTLETVINYYGDMQDQEAADVST